MQVARELGDAVGRDIFLYSITVDPDHDTVDKLRAYREQNGASWTFLTGRLDEVPRLRHRLGAFDPDPVVDADRKQHAGVLVYGSEPKGRWCAIPGLMKPASITRLVQRVMRL